MVDINSVNISGRINSEFKYISSDSSKIEVSFELVVECWGGERKKELQKFYIKAKGSKAKYLLDYASKDDVLMVSGALKNFEYTDKETLKKRIITYISPSECRIISRGGQ